MRYMSSQCKPLTTWEIDLNGNLFGTTELLMAADFVAGIQKCFMSQYA